MLQFCSAAMGAALLVASCAAAPEHAAEPAMARPTGFPQPGDLVVLLRTDNPYLTSTTALVARTGDERDKDAAAARLAALADWVGSDEWRARQRPVAARMSQLAQVSSSQRAAWLEELQRRHLVRIYDAMQILGGSPVLEHCRAVWHDEQRRPMERKLALGVLASHGLARKGAAASWSMPGSAATAGNAAVRPAPGPARFSGASGEPARRPDAPRVRGGSIANVEGVVDRLRPNFESCYAQALQQYGRFGAWIILVATVRADGRVQGVTGSGDDSVPYGMMTCLRNVVGQARFEPPSGGSAVVEIPLSFTVR